MSIKTLQIIVAAAMVMGDKGCDALPPLGQNSPFENNWSSQSSIGTDPYNDIELLESLDKQRNTGTGRYSMFLMKQENPNNLSWMQKLCKILECNQSDICVYSFGVTDCSGSDLVGNAILSFIQIVLKHNLSPKCFVEFSDWYDSPRQGDFPVKQYPVEKRMETAAQDNSTLWQEFFGKTNYPGLVIDDIYPGNILGDLKGGFKNFFEKLNIYEQRGCTTIFAGIFFDDNVQESLRRWISVWKQGMAWLFAIYKKKIYMIYFNKDTSLYEI